MLSGEGRGRSAAISGRQHYDKCVSCFRCQPRPRQEGKALRCCRQDTRNHNELGDVYCIDTEKNLVEAKHIDIAKWAKEMGVMKEWETVEA